MKNITLSIAITLFSAGAGAISYLTSKYFVKFYMEVLPIILSALVIILFFGRQFRRHIKPFNGFAILSVSMIVALSVLFLLMVNFPLPGMMQLNTSELTMRYLAVLGLGFLTGLILLVLIYLPQAGNTKVTN